MQHINPDLLERYIKGTCSEMEKKQVEEWLEQQAGYPEWASEAGDENEKSLKEELWQQIAQIPQAENRFRKPHLKGFWRWSLVAACMLVALTTIIRYVPWTGSPNMVTFEAPYGKKSTLRLHDGTIVELNAGAVLTYPEKFPSDLRQISLDKGEAFFDVATDPERPFSVRTHTSEVKVLGTRFNIRQPNGQNRVFVTLESGKVAFLTDGIRQVLQPGEQLEYNAHNRAVIGVKTVDVRQVSEWRSGILLFEGTPIREVFHILGDYYGVRFSLGKNMDERMRLTARFQNEPLEHVLKLVHVTTGLTCRQGNNIITVN